MTQANDDEMTLKKGSVGLGINGLCACKIIYSFGCGHIGFTSSFITSLTGQSL